MISSPTTIKSPVLVPSLDITKQGKSLFIHPRNSVVLKLDKNGMVLLHDKTGKGPSVYYDTQSDHVVQQDSTISFGDRRNQHLAMMVDSQHLIAIGGKSAACHDMATRQWRHLARPIVTRLSGMATLATSAGLYVFGGIDPDLTMIAKAEFLCVARWAWRPLPSLPVARSQACAVRVDSKIYLVGGDSRDASPGTTWIYSPTEELWKAGPSLVIPRKNAMTVVVGRSIVVMGGITLDTQKPVSAVEIWNTKQKVGFKIRAQLPSSQHCCAVAVDRDVYLFGGRSVGKISISDDMLSAWSSKEAVSTNSIPILPLLVDRQRQVSESLPSGNNTFPSLPSLPLRPNVPTMALTVPDRVRALQEYVSKLEVLLQDHDATVQNTLLRINEHYKRVRKNAIAEAHLEANTWTGDTVNFLDEANDELQQLQTLESMRKHNDLSSLLMPHESDPDDIPSQLRCPITLSLMIDPVVAADGNTYEKQSLETWLEKHEPGTPVLSPLTGAVLANKMYFPVHTLKSMCQEFGMKKEAN